MYLKYALSCSIKLIFHDIQEIFLWFPRQCQCFSNKEGKINSIIKAQLIAFKIRVI